jgi:hypothetical protein
MDENRPTDQVRCELLLIVACIAAGITVGGSRRTAALVTPGAICLCETQEPRVSNQRF